MTVPANWARRSAIEIELAVGTVVMASPGTRGERGREMAPVFPVLDPSGRRKSSVQARSLQIVTIPARTDRRARRTLSSTMTKPRPRPGIGFLLSQLGGQSSKRWSERLDRLGLEPREEMVLRFVATAEGRSQSEIARA